MILGFCLLLASGVRARSAALLVGKMDRAPVYTWHNICWVSTG